MDFIFKKMEDDVIVETPEIKSPKAQTSFKKPSAECIKNESVGWKSQGRRFVTFYFEN